MLETDANVWNYVIGAYSVTWVALTGYAIRLLVLNRGAVDVTAGVGGDT